jgi:hypothetical protein
MFIKKFFLFFFLIFFIVGLLNYKISNNKLNLSKLNNLGNNLVNMRLLTLSRIDDFKVHNSIINRDNLPEIGLFGSHQISFLSPNNLKKNFMLHNYSYADFSLFDVLLYLKKLKKENLLPTKKLVIFIVTPNNDNGNLITTTSGQTFHIINLKEIFLYNLSFNERLSIFKSFFIYYRNFFFNYQLTITHIKQLLNFNYLEDPISTKNNCYYQHQSTKFLFLKSDGSFDHNCIKFELIKNNNNNNGRVFFNQKDVVKLKYILFRILDFASENKLELIFVIPPVYEDERNTAADNNFNLALKDLDNSIKIVDQRELRFNHNFFLDYDHVSDKYLENLINNFIF